MDPPGQNELSVSKNCIVILQVLYYRFHCLFLLHALLTPPALPGWRSRGGRRHVKDAVLSHRRAHEVEVGAQHNQYGEEGEAEAEASGAAAQGEAEPVDQPATRGG